jgi:DNA-binding winged helix-turn-helix (wHTH) protein
MGGACAVQRRVPLIPFTNGRTFDPATGEVRAGDGVVHRLEPQPAVLLTLLVQRAGTVVGHDEIVRCLWPEGTHVDFRAGIHYAVRQARLALGEPAPAGAIIETLPRRGYRLRAAALAIASSVPSPATRPSATALTPARRGRRRVVLALATAALVAAVAVVERGPNDHHARAVALLRAVHDLVY